MNKLLLASALSLGLAGTALAGEGGGDPFPFSVPGNVVQNAPVVADTGSSALPDFPAAYSFAQTGEPTLEPNGQNGIVQTANSLPRGALEGTVAYAQSQSISRYFAEQAARRGFAAAANSRRTN